MLNEIGRFADGSMRYGVVAAWAVVFALRSPSIWRVLRGRPLFYDPLWALLALIGSMIVGYQVRFWFAPGNLVALFGLQLFSIGLAFAKLRLSRTYEAARRD